jgi:hypothetical protein
MKIQTESDRQLIDRCNRNDCRIFSYDTNPPFYSCFAETCDKEKNRTIKVLKSRQLYNENKKYLFVGPYYTYDEKKLD